MIKGKLKLILALSVVILCFFGIPFSFIIFEEFIYESKIILKDDSISSRGKPIYQVRDITKDNTSSRDSELETQKMIDAGFTAEETKILQAFESLWGGFSEEQINKYFGFENELVSKTITPLIIPAMCEELKWGINGELSIAQSIHELGWNYKAANIDEPTSPAWNYYNAHGIKVGSTEPNEFWTGSSETVSTKEYWTPGVASTIQDEFKSFNGFWESFQEHGRMLTEVGRYSVANFKEATGVDEYATKLKECGYYTDTSENYSATMESIYSRACLDKYRNLYKEVLAVINNDRLPEGEWKPEGEEIYGYFVEPSKGSLKNGYGILDNKTFNTGWDYKIKEDTKVLAIKKGRVVSLEPLTLEHNQGELSLYNNLTDIKVDINDNVTQGQIIGNATDILKFEIIKDKKYVDPKIYYDGKCGGEYKPKSAPDFVEYIEVVNTNGYLGTNSVTSSSRGATVYENNSAWINEFKVNLKGLSSKRLEFLQEATKHLGKPYLWAANGPDKFDCSGFTRWVAKHSLGIDVPRHSAHQVDSSFMEKVSLDKAKPGDLMWTKGHIAIFIRDWDSKNVIVMHAPAKNDKLKVSKYPKSKGLSYYRFKAYTD